MDEPRSSAYRAGYLDGYFINKYLCVNQKGEPYTGKNLDDYYLGRERGVEDILAGLLPKYVDMSND